MSMIWRHWQTCFRLVSVRMRISCLESSIKVAIYPVCTVCALVQFVDTWCSSFVSSRENRAFEDYGVVIGRCCAESVSYFACFLMKITVLCVFRLLFAELSRLFCAFCDGFAVIIDFMRPVNCFVRFAMWR